MATPKLPQYVCAYEYLFIICIGKECKAQNLYILPLLTKYHIKSLFITYFNVDHNVFNSRLSRQSNKFLIIIKLNVSKLSYRYAALDNEIKKNMMIYCLRSLT